MITDKIIDTVCKIYIEDSKKTIYPINELKKEFPSLETFVTLSPVAIIVLVLLASFFKN